MLIAILIALALVGIGQAARRGLAASIGVRGVRWVEVDRAYDEAPRVRRGVVALAGPLTAYFVVGLLHALAVPRVVSETTLVLEPVESLPAARAGLVSGDRAVAIDGHAVASWEELRSRILGSSEPRIVLAVDRDGRALTLEVERGDGGKIGVQPRMQDRETGGAERIDAALFGPWRNALTTAHSMVVSIAALFITEPRMEAVGGPVVLFPTHHSRGIAGVAAVLTAGAMPLAMFADAVMFALAVRRARRRA